MLIAEKSKAVEALVQPLSEPYPEEAPSPDELDPESSHLLDLSHSTRTYKTLLSGGHFDLTTKSVHVVDLALSSQFAQSLWKASSSEDAGGKDNVVRLAKGNAAFVLVELIESLKKAGKVGEVKSVLAAKEVVESIKSGERKGAALLVEKIELL